MAKKKPKLHLIQIHYHMRAGGVRVVVENIVHALRAANPKLELRSTVLTGSGHCQSLGDKVGEKGFSHRVGFIENLVYSEPEKKVRKAEIAAMVRRLRSQSDIRTDEQTVVVGHNVTLGKNPLLTAAFCQWAKEERKSSFVSLIHDFPEDQRPGNVKILQSALGAKAVSSWLYPSLANFHFAVINTGARKAMIKAGVPATKVHYTPNAVLASRFEALSDFHRMEALKRLWLELEAYARREHYRVSAGKRILFYPVRIIRRKNIAEAVLLLYLLGKEQWQLWISLHPESRAASDYWHRIRGCLKQLSVSVMAGFGDPFVHNRTLTSSVTLNELYNLCDAAITTSVQEGFGFAFCEGWLTNRPVWGRWIPGLTEDFQKSGLDMEHLYRHLRIPVEWVDRVELTKAYAEKIGLVKAGGRHTKTTGKKAESYLKSHKIRKGCIDFCDLDIGGQLEVLCRVEKQGTEEIWKRNPDLKGKVSRIAKYPLSRIRRAAQAVREAYSLESVGRKWLRVFSVVKGGGPVSTKVHAKLAKAFGDAEHTHAFL